MRVYPGADEQATLRRFLDRWCYLMIPEDVRENIWTKRDKFDRPRNVNLAGLRFDTRPNGTLLS